MFVYTRSCPHDGHVDRNHIHPQYGKRPEMPDIHRAEWSRNAAIAEPLVTLISLVIMPQRQEQHLDNLSFLISIYSVNYLNFALSDAYLQYFLDVLELIVQIVIYQRK